MSVGWVRGGSWRLWWMVGLLLVGASCSGEFGSLGELGSGTRFRYLCDPGSDNECDVPRPPCVYLCATDEPEEQIPPRIVVGSHFTVSTSTRADSVRSAAPDLLSGSGAFLALGRGEVALLALEDGQVVDFFHVRLVHPGGVRLEQWSPLGIWIENVRRVEVRVGETVPLRAVVMAGGEVLAGSLDTTWTSDNPSVVSIPPGVRSTVVTATADASGTATVAAFRGGYDAEVFVTVRDASGLF